MAQTTESSDRTGRRPLSRARVVCSRALLLALVLPLAAAGCGRAVESLAVAEEARPWNLVLILVDTLRADHLGTYGYPRDTSPVLDALAERSILFENAGSQASCTFPSANSILTSRFPAHFVGQPDQRMGIPEGIPSIAEILKSNGYATAAISASPIVRKEPNRHNRHGGFDRGFDIFHESCMWGNAACINQQAIPYLESSREPFFLYLHYMDPHDPYLPPKGYERRFAVGYEGQDFIAAGDPNPIARMLYSDGPRVEVTERDRRHLIDLYDDSIRSFDDQLGRLLAALAAEGLAGDTLVALVSDHGEEFLEHGHIKHCRTLFETELHTPMILHLPGQREGRRVEELAANLDLVPTLLDYLGIDTSSYAFDGLSLRPAIERGRQVRQRIFSWQATQRGLREERYKLIFQMRKRRFELYDLTADPAEKADVLTSERRTFARMKGELSELMTTLEPQLAERSRLAAGLEAERQLKALGYLQ